MSASALRAALCYHQMIIILCCAYYMKAEKYYLAVSSSNIIGWRNVDILVKMLNSFETLQWWVIIKTKKIHESSAKFHIPTDIHYYNFTSSTFQIYNISVYYVCNRTGTMVGYWEPHSSSVEFCEPNYILTPYVAEPHNVSHMICDLYEVFRFLDF